MKTNYYLNLIILCLFLFFGNLSKSFAQFSCATAVNMTNGFSQVVTTPGNGGAEDWVTSATTCGISSNYFTTADVYLFSYTSTSPNEVLSVSISTNNSWTGVMAFTACTGTTFSDCLEDDSNFFSSADLSISVGNCDPLPLGTTVYFAVGQNGSSSTAPDDLDFTINFSASMENICVGPTAATDDCNDAPTIDFTIPYCGSTNCCYTNASEGQLCGAFGIHNNSWIQFTASGADVVIGYEVTDCTQNDGIQIGVFEGTCNNFTQALACENSVLGAGDFTLTGLTPGQSYFIMVDGWAGDLCDFCFKPDGGIIVCDNDLCINANPFECGQPNIVNGIDCATDDDAPVSCAGDGLANAGLWYAVTGDGGDITLSTSNPTTNFPARLHVYGGACGALACEPSAIGNGTSDVTFTSINGLTYFVYLDGTAGATGIYELSIDCDLNPSCFATINSTNNNSTAYCYNETPTTIGNDLNWVLNNFNAGPMDNGNGGVAFVQICGAPWNSPTYPNPNDQPEAIGMITDTYSYNPGQSTGLDGNGTNCPYITLVPITYTDFDGLNYTIDPACYAVGSPITVTFVPEITETSGAVYNCVTNSITLSFAGGSQTDEAPNTVGGNYTLSGDITGTTSAGSITLSNLAPGTINYTATDPAGCGQSFSFVVPVVVDPTFVITNTYCLNGVPDLLPLISDNGITGTWSPAVINTSAIGMTTYTFTPTPGICANTTPLNVDILIEPTATVSGGGIVCAGDPLPDVTLTLTGIPPFDFTYSDGINSFPITGYTNNIFTITNAPMGTYTFTSMNDAICNGILLGSAITAEMSCCTAEAGTLSPNLSQVVCDYEGAPIQFSSLIITGDVNDLSPIGQNTDAANDYLYILTNQSGLIVESNASFGSLTVPQTPGNYCVWGLSYEISQGIIVSNGSNLSTIVDGDGDPILTPTTANSCMDLTDLCVTFVVLPIEDATFSFDSFCCGTDNGPYDITTPGGTFDFFPNLMDGAIINTTTGVISNCVPGASYVVRYTTGGLCPGTSIVVVTATQPPDCNDNDCSTIDVFDPVLCLCGNIPDPSLPLLCDDGICANGVETYNTNTCSCDPGTPPVDPGCDDGICTNGIETWDGCNCVAGTPPVDPGCDDGICTNGIETWDGCNCVAGTPPVDPGCDDGICTNGIETWDGCNCVAGTPPVDPGCDDGICTNGIETWDGCNCVAGTPPVDPGCDDGICANGVETWDGCNCIAGTPPVDPGCDDGICNNGVETWDGCNCVAGTPPVDPGCDDGICANGVETWDGCNCIAGTPPVDPGCDDGICNNGVETWDGCNCVAGTPPVDPGCDDGICANGVETWDGCNCIAGTPPVDPGCDDGICANGVETWDGCNCIAGTPPVDPGCDDGICNNGVETWDGCNCVAGTPPVDPGCDDGICANGVETWDGCNCVAGTPPVDPGCDDGICANGVETWDGCNCIAGTPPVDPGCDDGICNNGVETWDGCNCVAGTPPVDPGCDDGICANGVETWDGCNCIAGTPPVDPGCDDGICNNGVETWDGCNCVAGTPPVDPGCDDGICANGVETWDGCNCIAGTPPVDPGCDDGICNNGVETWDGCNCVAGTPPVDPGCDDGICANGVETWDGCNCVAGTPPVDPGCDDGICNNGVETWDGCNCVAGTPPVDPGCDDGICANGVETWDGCNCVAGTPPVDPGCDDGICANGLEFWDGCECQTGTPPVDPGCDDGICANGVETWNTNTCQCDPGTPPVVCVDDGDCNNGFEVWDEDNCECIVTSAVFGCMNSSANNFDPTATCDDGSCTFPCPDPGCDDGICSNGVETWDGNACECIPGTPPVDPGCDDGICVNGVETWDGCDCVAGTPPVDPGCDDGICSNGIETWDGCDCIAGTPPVDPGCDDGICANGLETWDGCDCVAGTPPVDPGCDDGICSNGIETWDGCDCIAGTPPVDPGCDDGICANGLETWDGCDCVAGTPPVDPGCDDGICSNGIETWDGCDCIAGTPPVDPGCDDGICANGLETWDGCDCVAGTPPVDPGCDDGICSNGIETWDGCDCIAGTPPVDPGCDDGICANGLETWDGCDCVAGTPPIDPGCDDGICSNGLEFWDGCDCQAGTPPVDPGCDDGICANGIETWDGCDCQPGTPPIDPGCDDGICSNGLEFWDGCDCQAGTPPVDPGCDDGICANGIETWNTNTCQCDPGTPPVVCVDDGDCNNGFETWDENNCECIVTPSVLGCTNTSADNYDPAATCDDGSCTFPCPDPGCDDGICSNGIETWDGNACECIPGTPPVDPGCDDGICSNGIETWDGCDCIAGTPPVDPGCDDGDCSNGIETWDGCDCIAGTPPVDPGCDDGICANGIETWDGCDCQPGTPPIDPGCDDGICSNGLEFWDGCDCQAGTPPVDPGCDDGNCANGVETWNTNTCQCDPGTPPVVCVDDGDCNNGFETWDENNCECIVSPPVLGCTNTSADNYDPAATCDDGSCTFPCPDPGCDDGICSNGIETWDGNACDCIPGTPPVDPGCDDGICSNGIEIWDGCDCIAGTPPVDPGCDDGDCSNGIETWDGCDCIAGTPPVDPGCDDGICANGIETWDGCDCVTGTPPIDPGCDDGICANGLEFWDGCDCQAGTPPVDPGCDDGICANGVETWNTNTCQCDPGTPPVVCVDDGDCNNGFEAWDNDNCECIVTSPVLGCTNISADNYDPTATCDDGSCTFPCPDPGCDDGICSNGVETWDGINCECVAGTPPTPCTDDGDCNNGFEMWDNDNCECIITPAVFGCTDLAADNYDPAATCDDGSCTTTCPDPGCDDGVCANGIETWDFDNCECVAGTPVIDPGCDDGICSNGVETWNEDNCECIAGTPPTPCTDDGDCNNGFEVWDNDICDCIVTPPVLGCTNMSANNFDPAATCDDGSCDFDCPDPGCDDGVCSNGVETWDGINCECVAGTPPTPCTDDGDCNNGFEMWDNDNCECIITPAVFGCTDPAADNYDPAATCDDGSCTTTCPDPGCDDGVCANGIETWDFDNCECVAGTPVIDPGCDDGICSNGVETWDEDNCECIAGTPPTPCTDDGDCNNGFEVWDNDFCDCIVTPPVLGCTNMSANNFDPAATCDDGSCDFDCPDPGCDDGICSNGVETWDGINCECVAGTPPTPCTDDGDCNNGFEMWDNDNCECIITPAVFGCTDPAADNYDPEATCDDGSCTTTCPDPGCDDGVCANGIETWDFNNCECVPGTPVIDPGCDDGICSNGVETWDEDNCECIAGTPPTPCTDDGDCNNGFEVWDNDFCDCIVTPPVLGCTNMSANNFDPAATCDDGSCDFDCPDPGCDDGICSNGVETWDGINCECVAGTPPTPCTDDGDCNNGFEMWDNDNCECIITPAVFGCTDPAADNYDPAATCDDGSCTTTCPDPGCDDGVCANGIETWDFNNCECVAGTPVIDPGCDDGICSNGVETWDEDNCECVAGTPPNPCVDDGDCTNGFEIWDEDICDCIIGDPFFGCTDPDADNYNPLATCDDGSCVTTCPDPGCDDGVCANGVETWDFDICDCIPGTPPTPCTDDGDCTNGFEVWNDNTCECDVTPPVLGCTDPAADNYDPAATCDDGTCAFDCVLTINSVIETACNNNGTLSDNTDDTFMVTINVSAVNGSGNYTVNSNLGDSWNGTYDEDLLISPLNANGMDITLTILDSTDLSCVIQTIVNQDACSACDISADAGQNQIITCNESFVQLEGTATAGATTFWVYNNGVDTIFNDLTPEVSDAGSWELFAFISDDCFASNSTIVFLDDVVPLATPEDEMITCDDSFVTLQANSSIQNVTYQWSGPDPDLDVTAANPMVDVPGIYSLIVVDTANNCPSPEVMLTVIDSTDIPLAVIVSDPSVSTIDCTVESIQLLSDGSTIGSTISYQWSDNEANTWNTPSIIANDSSTYTLTVLDLLTGCDNQESIVIDIGVAYPTINFDEPEVLTCILETIEVDATDSPFPAGVIYQWGELVGLDTIPIPDQMDLTLDVTTPGTYCLSAYDPANGCSNAVCISVDSDIDLPAVQAGNNQVLDCNTGETELDGSTDVANAQYSWAPLGGIVTGSNAPNPTVNNATTYYLTVTNPENQCSATDSVVIIDAPLPIPTATSKAPDCYQDNDGEIRIDTVIGGTAPYLYSIDDGETFSPLTAFGNLESGAYNLVVQDANGCESEVEEVVVNETQQLVIDLETILEIRLGDSIQLDAQTNIPPTLIDTLIWTPTDSLSCLDCLDPWANPTYSTTYTLVIKDTLGCEAEERVQVIVDENLYVYIPTGFSPDGDGYNDVLMIYAGIGIEEIKLFSVFDRWGNQVFEAQNFQPNDPENGWDGTFKGQEVNPAVFVYVAEIVMIDGSVKIVKGDITLLR